MDPRFDQLSPAEQQEYLALKEGINLAARENPLLAFHACVVPCGSPTCLPRPQQAEYMAAHDRIVLLAAGNRMGKTTANVVWAIIQHCPDDILPERLRVFKRPRPDHWAATPVAGRYIAPSEKALLSIVLPELQRWVPPAILRGGNWTKAYTDKAKVIHFRDGGRMELYTSEQEAKVFVGTSLDYTVFDEPTTEPIWNESWMRLTDKQGQARFGLTPVNMVGGGIGFLYRNIYKPGLAGEPFKGTTLVPRVLRATIHDNPLLSEETIAEALAIYDEDEREARETGEFVAFGGLVYPRFKSFLAPLDPMDEAQVKMVKSQQTVVGIDPSYRRAAFVWVAFNDLNQGLVYHVEYVKKGDPAKFAQALRRGNSLWQLEQQPLYVMDPYAGGQHSMIAGQAVTIRTELQQLGFYTQSPKVLDSKAIVYGGVQNIWRRMAEHSFAVGSCVHPEYLLEAEEYRTEDRDDGVFEVVKEFDDGMDATRYAFTTRPWYPRSAQQQPKSQDFRPGIAPNWERYIEGPTHSGAPVTLG